MANWNRKRPSFEARRLSVVYHPLHLYNRILDFTTAPTTVPRDIEHITLHQHPSPLPNLVSLPTPTVS